MGSEAISFATATEREREAPLLSSRVVLGQSIASPPYEDFDIKPETITKI